MSLIRGKIRNQTAHLNTLAMQKDIRNLLTAVQSTYCLLIWAMMHFV